MSAGSADGARSINQTAFENSSIDSAAARNEDRVLPQPQHKLHLAQGFKTNDELVAIDLVPRIYIRDLFYFFSLQNPSVRFSQFDKDLPQK